MKLYEVPRNTYVRIVNGTPPPPGAKPMLDAEVVLFKHIDGMYSYCIDADGDVVHLNATTEVEIVRST